MVLPGETPDVFHYTNAESGLKILDSMEFRLGALENMNDLREARANSASMQAHEDDVAFVGNFMDLYAHMDTWMRRYVRLGSFTRDFEVDPRALDMNARRGWAHPALWAHYGGSHSGLCLRFNRARLIEAFSVQLSEAGRLHAGDVIYETDPLPKADNPDMGQIREFGLDAALWAYMNDQREYLLFTKHTDWANEEEFRLICLGRDERKIAVDVSQCLTGVFFGDQFPHAKVAEAKAVLMQRE